MNKTNSFFIEFWKASVAIGLALLLVVSFFEFLNVSAAPSTTNNIAIRIARVYLAEADEFDTDINVIATNDFSYSDTELQDDDEIRYAWENIDLDTLYIDAPSSGGGYLKVYLDDDSTEDNFIQNHGTSPLLVGDIASRLTEGPNTILLVLADNPDGIAKDVDTKIQFSFDYKPKVKAPSMQVVKPGKGVIISSETNNEFELDVKNFKLVEEPTKGEPEGKLLVYHTQKKEANLLQTITANEDNKVKFDINSFGNTSSIPDGDKTKLIFALVDSEGGVVGADQVIEYNTNFNGTLVNENPSISIVTPLDNDNISVDYRFDIDVQNYKLLSGINSGNSDKNTGFMQVRVNNRLVEEAYDKSHFTLRSLGLEDTTGATRVSVNLTDDQFRINDENLSDEVVVNVNAAAEASGETGEVQAQNSSWRVVVMILTVVLILGSIAVLITRG